MALEEKIDRRLEELHGSGFEIVDGQPNIRGWKIKSHSGKRMGEVDDLLFDPNSRKVRYIVVDLDDNELDISDDRKVLIPIGIAELYTKSDSPEDRYHDPAYSSYDPADDGNVVYLPTVSAEQLDALPLYERGRLSQPIEMAIRRILEPVANSSYNQEEFYRHDHFNDDRFYHHHKKH